MGQGPHRHHVIIRLIGLPDLHSISIIAEYPTLKYHAISHKNQQ